MSEPTNILYLEDDIPLGNLVKRKLERKGYYVELSTDGMDCLKKLRNDVVDLFIVDFQAPSLNGLEVLSALKKQSIMPLSIMVSGNRDAHIVIEAMKLGCSDYVIKEINNYIDLLLVSVEKVLEKQALINAKELAEYELIKNKQNLERAQKLAKVGSWEYYPGDQAAYWSEQEYLNFNCELSDTPDFHKYIRYIHPDDKARVKKINANCLEKKQAVDFDFRLLFDDNSIRHLHSHTQVDVDSDNQITRIFGITKDITNEVNAAAKLKQAATVFNSTTEAIFITDENNLISSINPAYTVTTGYTEEDALGKDPAILNSGHHDKEFFNQFWIELKTRGQWQGEIWNRHKDGHIFPVWQSITAIKDDSGKIIQFVSIFNDISSRKADEELIRYQANYDSLTGLPNRNLFLDRINIALKQAQRHKNQLALLLLDLDRFKWINDTLGHKTGDIILQETAKRLIKSVRDSDTVARLGGDEFAIIMPEISHYSDTEIIANKIFSAFKAPLSLEGHEIHISGSIGITLFPDDGDNVESLQMNADSAMYYAKEDGRNRYHYFTPRLQAKAERHLLLVNYLQQALHKDEFEIYYQPIIDQFTHQIISAEALIRWYQPQLGFISPEEFIPLAENSGLIRAIGNWVVLRVAENMQRWQELGLKPINVSINKSAHQFSKNNCDKDWLTIFKQHNIDVSRITVEITESVFMEKGHDYVASLSAMQKQGMKISLDDFGTGYSSLSYLKRFPVDFLKIDRSFIHDVTKDSDDAMLVEMILSLADKMNIQVVAEGVETIEQLNFLKRNNCRYIQGYFFSTPLALDEFETFLSKPLP